MKKLLSGVLILATVVGLVGCSGEKAKVKNTSEVSTLTWLIPGGKQTDVNSVMEAANKIIEPAIGAKLDLQFVDFGAYAERMKMNMASGNGYDLCFTANWLNDYQKAVLSGGLMDITDIIDKDVPKLKEIIPDYVLNSARVKEKIYGIPNIQVMTNPLCFTVFNDISNKYKFDFSTVKKASDIEPYLKMVKEGEKNIYPYRSSYGISMWIEPVYEYVVGDTNVLIKKDDPTKKCVLSYETEEFKTAVNTLRSWYEKGYIRQDAASVGDDSTDVKMNKYAVDCSTWKPGGEALQTRKATNVLLNTPYLKREGALQTMISVGAHSKNPVKAVKLIEMMNSNKELYNLICFGLEGKHYTLNEDKRVKYTDNSGYAPKADWMFGNQFNAYLNEGVADDVWKQTADMNAKAVKSPLIGFVPDLTSITNEISQVSSVISEFKIMHQGADDPKNYMDTFIKKLNEAGQQKILVELQKQVDEFTKNKK
jgi:putative aldouronate transport system substrate-binding protein